MTVAAPLSCWQASSPGCAGLALSVAAALEGPELLLEYSLSWPATTTTALLIPQAAAAAQPPRRRDGLWHHTCFEAFVGAAGSPHYWELNLSPNGDWNVYRFSAYRSGQQSDEGYAALPCTRLGPRAAPPHGDCRQSPPRALVVLALRWRLPPALQAAGGLQLGLASVLEHSDGALSYWALQHPGSEPDFHDARGWTLSL